MKKLLLFVIVLFGTLSVQSLAGCAAQICTCPYGGYVSYGEYCPGPRSYSAPRVTYYGGIAINPHTRRFSSTWYYQDGEKARAAALDGCGGNSCVSTWASSFYMAIAISEDDNNWGYGAANTQSDAWYVATTMCQRSGKTCHVALVGHPTEEARYVYWGAVVYNPDTGQTGKTSDELRKRTAEDNALVRAGCARAPSTNCQIYAFQYYAYGALAKGESNKVFYGSSNKSLKDAEKYAEMTCKKATGDKHCKALVSSAKQTYK